MPTPRKPRVRAPLLAWMVLAIAIVAALAYWDEQRESADALVDFAAEQATLATGVSVALRSSIDGDRPVLVDEALLLTTLRAIEKPGAIRMLARRPAGAGLLATDGTLVRSAAIEDGFRTGAAWVRLARSEASELGLPARTAMAGLAPIEAGSLEHWGVAVVATARRERDRELHAQWRLVLGVVVASGLVLAFGGLALRKQRQELELARELAVAEIRQERDERLVRADKLATLGALATGVAHEVSTPLGVIVGRAEQLLPRVEHDEKAKRAVEVIAEQATRISRVVRGLLGLARGDSPAMEQTEPSALARSAIELVEHRFTQADVDLTTDVAPDLPRVTCEPRLFEQVLVNLLLNACDACEKGGKVILSIRAAADRVAFGVTDDGSGITSEAVARATEPFFTTKPAGEGTGLGLAIANEIVKHHHGTLTLAPRAPHDGASSRSRGGRLGTRACVEIPAAPRSHG